MEVDQITNKSHVIKRPDKRNEMNRVGWWNVMYRIPYRCAKGSTSKVKKGYSDSSGVVYDTLSASSLSQSAFTHIDNVFASAAVTPLQKNSNPSCKGVCGFLSTDSCRAKNN